MKLILYTSQLKSVGGVSSQNVGVGGKGPLNVDVGGLDDVNPKNFDMGPFHYIVIPYMHFFFFPDTHLFVILMFISYANCGGAKIIYRS